MTADGPKIFALEDLLANPALLTPPRAVLHRLAWVGRVTLLAAQEKSGKSTLLGQAVARLAMGEPFLDTATDPVPVFWLALDEPLADVVRRLASFGATRRVWISSERLAADELEEFLISNGVGLLVVDTLTEFGSGVVDDFNAASDWTPVLRTLREIATRCACACVLLHHTKKAGRGYRDSSQIGAGVDVILEMAVDDQDPTVRRIRARGRVPVQDFALRYAGHQYQLEDGELPLEMRVYRVIEAEPGISARQLRTRVAGRGAEIDAAVATLLRTRAISDRGNGHGRRFVAEGLKTPGHGRDTVRDTVQADSLSDAGHGADTGRTRSRTHPMCPTPLRGGGGTRSEMGAPEDPPEAQEERLAIAEEGCS